MLRSVFCNRLMVVAFTLVGGEVAGFALGSAASLWPWLASLAAVGALAAYGWGILGRLLLPQVFVLGCALGARTEAARLEALDLRRYVAVPAPMEVRVESQVHAWRARKHEGWTVDFLSHCGTIPIKVVIQLPDDARIPERDETWVCVGRMTCPREGENRLARHVLWVRDGAGARRVSPARATPLSRYRRLGDILSEQISLGLGWAPELAEFNRAILLGQRSALSRARKDMFAAAGTIHVFAISGLHVMVIAMVLGGMLARLDVPLMARGLMTLPLVAAYVMVTGMRPSAVRAATMLAFYLVAPLFGRRPDGRTAWALTAIGVYGISPERIFDVGCMLSFAVMFGIVAWLEWSRRFKPLLPMDTWRGRLLFGMGVSFAAWVAGVPISAQTFGRFSVGGLLANVAVIFVAGWMVRFGVFGLWAGFLCVPLAACANNLAAVCTGVMVKVSEVVASLPLAVVETPRWTWLDGVAWYLSWLFACFLAGRLLSRWLARSGRWWLPRAVFASRPLSVDWRVGFSVESRAS